MRKFQLLKKKPSTTTKFPPRISKSTSTTLASQIQTMAGSELPNVIEDENSLHAPEILPGLMKSTSSDQYDCWTVPTEVTVIEVGPDGAKENGTTGEKMRHVSQIEVEEYLQQIQDTQKLVDRRTVDLNRSRLQVAELIKQNSRLLKELKAATGQDDATSEEHRLMKQELNMLKGCLFFGALWIWFGGRADVIGIVAFVWMLADASSY